MARRRGSGASAAVPQSCRGWCSGSDFPRLQDTSCTRAAIKGGLQLAAPTCLSAESNFFQRRAINIHCSVSACQYYSPTSEKRKKKTGYMLDAYSSSTPHFLNSLIKTLLVKTVKSAIFCTISLNSVQLIFHLSKSWNNFHSEFFHIHCRKRILPPEIQDFSDFSLLSHKTWPYSNASRGVPERHQNLG